jgi:hypothetical protein
MAVDEEEKEYAGDGGNSPSASTTRHVTPFSRLAGRSNEIHDSISELRLITQLLNST